MAFSAAATKGVTTKKKTTPRTAPQVVAPYQQREGIGTSYGAYGANPAASAAARTGIPLGAGAGGTGAGIIGNPAARDLYGGPGSSIDRSSVAGVPDYSYASANTGTTGGFPNATGSLTTQTPFGSSISADQLAAIWQDPQGLATRYFNEEGLGKFGGAYARTLDDAQRAGLLYLLLNNNAPGGVEQYGNAGPVDWYGNYVAEGFKPGGQSVGPQDIANSLFHANKGTPVYDALYGTPQTEQEQIDNWINTLSAGLKDTMPDPVYQSLIARYQQAGRDFRDKKYGDPTNSMTFGRFLEQQGLGGSRYGV